MAALVDLLRIINLFSPNAEVGGFVAVEVTFPNTDPRSNSKLIKLKSRAILCPEPQFRYWHARRGKTIGVAENEN